LAKLPNPPRDLARIPPELRTLPAGTELWRIYKRAGRHPVLWSTFRSFGPLSSARFDHHTPGLAGEPRLQDRMILYAALQIPTCVAEFFQRSRTIDPEAEQPFLAGFELRKDIVLLDLTALWPTQAGASMVINSGPRSRAVHDAYPGIQGLYYASSMHANRPALALYERARPALAPVPLFNRPLSDPALLVDLDRIALNLGYGLV
jgi:hypothetical protein